MTSIQLSDLEKKLLPQIPDRDRDIAVFKSSGNVLETEIEQQYALCDMNMSYFATLLSAIPSSSRDEILEKIVLMAGPIPKLNDAPLSREESIAYLKKTTGRCGYQHFRALVALTPLYTEHPKPELFAFENLVNRKVHNALVTAAAFAAISIKKEFDITFKGHPDIENVLEKTHTTAQSICPGINAEVHYLDRSRCIMKYWHHPLYAQFETLSEEEQHRAALEMTPVFWGLDRGKIEQLTSTRSAKTIIEQEFAQLGLKYAIDDGILYLYTKHGAVRIGRQVPITLGRRKLMISKLLPYEENIQDLYLPHFAKKGEELKFDDAPRGILIETDIPMNRKYLEEELEANFDVDTTEMHAKLGWGNKYLFKSGIVYGAPYTAFRMSWNPQARASYALPIVGLGLGIAEAAVMSWLTSDLTHFLSWPAGSLTVGILLQRLQTYRQRTSVIRAELSDVMRDQDMAVKSRETVETQARTEKRTRKTLQIAIEQEKEERKYLEEIGAHTRHDGANVVSGIIGNAELAEMTLDESSKMVHWMSVGSRRRATESARLHTILENEIAQLSMDTEDPEIRKRIENLGEGLRSISETDLSDNDKYENLENTLNALAQYIHKSTQSAQRMVDILALLKDDAPYERVDFDSYVKKILCDELEGTSITYTIDGKIPSTVFFQKNIVGTFLQNSIQNSKQAGATRIEIKYCTDEEFIYCDVADDGEGFDEDIATRITTPKFTTKSFGHGIGLYSVRRRAERNGGSYHINSPGAGKGAYAELTLPYKTTCSTRL